MVPNPLLPSFQDLLVIGAILIGVLLLVTLVAVAWVSRRRARREREATAAGTIRPEDEETQ